MARCTMAGCVFRRDLGTRSGATWATDSGGTWALVPEHLGTDSGAPGHPFRTLGRRPELRSSAAGVTAARHGPRARRRPCGRNHAALSHLPGAGRADVDAAHHAKDSRSIATEERAGLLAAPDPGRDGFVQRIARRVPPSNPKIRPDTP